MAGVTTPIAVSTYTVAVTDTFLVFNINSIVTVTLPTASSFTGRVIYMKEIGGKAVNSASTNVIPRTSNTAGTAILSLTAGSWATLVSNGTNWVIMAGA